MKTTKLPSYLYAAHISLILVMMVLVGCNTIEAGTETTPKPENLTYANNVYGFAFEYPQSWTLIEDDHGILLINGRNRLGIRYRWSNETVDRLPGRKDIPEGELIYGDRIRFMGKVIPAEVLLFESKNKIVYYGGRDHIEIDELVFSITLEDRETYSYRDINLSEEIIAEANSILETFKRIDSVEETTKGADIIGARLAARLEVPEHLATGEKVNLKFVLKNVSETPLYILRWYTPIEGIAGEIFRVTRDGQTVPYRGIVAYRNPPTADEYIWLNPGESVSAVVNLGEAYDFSKTGEYRIRFLPPRISHIARTESEMAKTLEELGPVEIPSNVVSMEQR